MKSCEMSENDFLTKNRKEGKEKIFCLTACIL